VKVNGKVYEVELESVTKKPEEIKAEPRPAVIQEPKLEVKPEPRPAADSGNRIEVKAPMQGTIIDVKAKVGDAVRKGQTVVVLEAMKLENDIVASASGVIQEIMVSKGQNVKNQQVLMIIG
jgi:biotin carboxyl carrier protein